jgi:hypothetical protein
VPRSGSSWLGQIINSHPETDFRFQPLFSFEFQAKVDKAFAEFKIGKLLQDIFKTESEFLMQKSRIKEGSYPQFKKSQKKSFLAFKENSNLQRIDQILEQVNECVAIFLVRDPIKVIESWISSPREFKHGLSISDEWNTAPSRNLTANQFFGYQRWEYSTKEFQRLVIKYPKRTMIVSYEDLVRDTSMLTTKIFKFLGLEMASSTLNFLTDSTSLFQDNPYSVFRFSPKKQLGPYNLSSDIVSKIRLATIRAGLGEYLLHK